MIKEIVKTARVLGVSRIWELYRGYRLGWQGILSGFYTTRILQTLFNVGFFDHIQRHGSVQLDDFAAENGLDPEILQSLCDSLYAQSILTRNGVGYKLDEKGEVLANVARGWFDGVYGYEDVYHNLEALLRQEKVYGEDIYRRPDFIARGSAEMEDRIYFPIAIDIIQERGYRSVLDLGCGEATFLRRLCRETPAQGFGLDRAAEAVAEGQEKIDAAGLADRISLHLADINELDAAPLELAQIDAATIFFVLHEVLWISEDAAIRFLQSFKRLFPGVPLIVFEVLRPTPDEMRRRPGMIVHYLVQHDLTQQKLVSREEWLAIFAKAGMTVIDERVMNFARTGIFTLQ